MCQTKYCDECLKKYIFIEIYEHDGKIFSITQKPNHWPINLEDFFHASLPFSTYCKFSFFCVCVNKQQLTKQLFL